MGCGYCGGPLVEGMTVAELAGRDFNRATWRRLFGRLVGWLKGGEGLDGLACFAVERSRRVITGRRSLGRQTVELAKVVGSVGRCRSFDRAFLPACSCLGERWRRVDMAFHEGKQLPPVRLYKLGERYFVEDGNHRVSVSRYRKLPLIEAEVTELLDAGVAAAGLIDEPKDRKSGGKR